MTTPSVFHRRASAPADAPLSALSPSAFDASELAAVPAWPRDLSSRPAARGAARRRALPGALRGPLLVTALVAAALAVTWAASVPALAAAASAVAWLRSRDDGSGRAALTVVLAAGAALAFVVAWARATAPRRPVRLAGGRGRIAIGEVEDCLQAMLLERPDLVAASVEVENRHRRGVWVSARLDVTPDARLEDTIDAATHAVEELVYRRLGLDLAGPPRFDLRYDELDLRAGRAHDFGAPRGRPDDGGRRHRDIAG